MGRAVIRNGVETFPDYWAKKWRLLRVDKKVQAGCGELISWVWSCGDGCRGRDLGISGTKNRQYLVKDWKPQDGQWGNQVSVTNKSHFLPVQTQWQSWWHYSLRTAKEDQMASTCGMHVCVSVWVAVGWMDSEVTELEKYWPCGAFQHLGSLIQCSGA